MKISEPPFGLVMLHRSKALWISALLHKVASDIIECELEGDVESLRALTSFAEKLYGDLKDIDEDILNAIVYSAMERN